MKNNLTIRKAKILDIPKITKLWTKLMDYHKKFDPERYRFKRNSTTLYKKFLKKRIKSRKSAVFVAELKNNLLGNLIVAIGRLPPIYKADREGYIDEVFVEDKFRGKGIGTKLLKAAEEWSRKKKLHYLSLSVDTRNTKVIKIYKSFGLKAHHIKLSKIIEVI